MPETQCQGNCDVCSRWERRRKKRKREGGTTTTAWSVFAKKERDERDAIYAPSFPSFFVMICLSQPAIGIATFFLLFSSYLPAGILISDHYTIL